MHALLALTLTGLLAGQDTSPSGFGDVTLLEPAPADMAAWRAHVRPTGKELAFESLDWIPEFARGLEVASEEGKPLLFWAMNGHPLGCT